MNTYFNGFDTQEVTFKVMGSVLPKKAVALQHSGEIYYPEIGGDFTGVVSSTRSGIASVIIHGHAEGTFKNTIPTIGICKLSVGNLGAFEVDEENGKPYTVLSVNLNSKTFEFLL